MKKMTEQEWRKKAEMEIVVTKGQEFLEALVRFCNGNPDKVAEGAGVWMAVVKAQAMMIKAKYPNKFKKKG